MKEMSNDLIIQCLNERMEFRNGYNIQCILRWFYNEYTELYNTDRLKFYEDLIEHLKYNGVVREVLSDSHTSVWAGKPYYTLYIKNGELMVQTGDYYTYIEHHKFTLEWEKLVNIEAVLKGEFRIENWFGIYFE